MARPQHVVRAVGWVKAGLIAVRGAGRQGAARAAPPVRRRAPPAQMLPELQVIPAPMKFESAPETGWAEAALGLWAGIDLWVQIAVLAGIAALLLWQLWRLVRPARRRCRWTRDRVTRRSGMVRWQCMDCAVDAFTQDGKPPKECKRALREAGL